MTDIACSNCYEDMTPTHKCAPKQAVQPKKLAYPDAATIARLVSAR